MKSFSKRVLTITLALLVILSSVMCVSVFAANTTVYFYNSGKWANVYGYVWGSSEALGSWPGTKATSDGGNWYKISVPANAADGFNIIFNDGGNGKQAGNNYITDTTNVYLTTSADKLYASKAEAEKAAGSTPDVKPSTGSTTVYYLNSANWSTVSAYVWGASEALGAWPGTQASSDGGKWVKVKVPLDASSGFNIIFNDGNQLQAGNNYIDNATDVYLTFSADAKYSSKKDAEAAASKLDIPTGPSKGTTTVYYYNTKGWSDVTAYVYGGVVGEILGAWPGKAATNIGNYWWKIDVPTDAAKTSFNIIFNNAGAGSQACDMFINDHETVYTTYVEDGKYTSKAEAESKISLDTAVLTNTTRVFFLNNEKWAKVTAYVYGNSGELLGGWPGKECKQDGTSNWYYIDVPTNAYAGAFNIIFSDGGNGKQAKDGYIFDTEHVFVTLDGAAYTSAEEAKPGSSVGGHFILSGQETTIAIVASALVLLSLAAIIIVRRKQKAIR
ncbi:MAG: starch-binding protein [Ruminococcus sp.]